jgi:hypothetical protein
LLATLAEGVIDPAEGKVEALQARRRKIEAELTEPNSSSRDESRCVGKEFGKLIRAI